MKYLLIAVCFFLLGCVRTSGMAHTRTALNVGAALVLELDRLVAASLLAADRECQVETATGPGLHAQCMAPYYKAEGALILAQRQTLAAARGLDAIEGNADGNPGRVLGCMAAAIGEALRAAEAVGVRPGSVPGQAWAAYSGTISNLCMMSEPGAMVSSGSAEVD